MKNVVLYLIIFLFSCSLNAQEIDAGSAKLIEDHIKSRLNIEKELINPQAVEKVFYGTFYKVGPGFFFPDGYGGCIEYYLNLNDGKVTELQKLGYDMEMKELLALLRKEFRLKDEAGAVIFETALNALFPVDEKDKPDVRHMKKNNQWIFLRGKFFDDDTAVIVSVNPDGTVSKIYLILAYTVN